MKTSINQDSRQGKYNRYPQESLSVKDALTWFIITVIALCIAGQAQAKSIGGGIKPASAPVAYDITMSPVVQASSILPLNASSNGGNISSFTIQTIPPPAEGVLSISINGLLIPVGEGMMLTPDLVNHLVFTPDSSFNGNTIFTYSANDEEGIVSNVATYTIPVIGKQQVILPINLLSFKGAEENRQVQLYWQTENEGNSSYFELQRSSDGNNFETFATVRAKGSTSLKNNYQSTDDLFFYPFRVVYYRLKMVNANGGFKYSSSVMIQLGAAVKAPATAWPVPFTSNLNIAYNSERNEPVKLAIHGVNGSNIMTIHTTVKKGSNTIVLYQAQNIPAGAYLLTISNSASAETIKVIKQ